MTYLVEDPTYLLSTLGVAVVGCLVALRITQDGRYLIWAGGLAAAAAAFFLFERLWVTDAERVEAVVYDLADAVEKSDVDRVNKHLDRDVTVNRGGRSRTLEDTILLATIPALLQRAHFDTVRISRLTTRVGQQTRLGTAEFRAIAFGSYEMGMGGSHAFTSGVTEWSLAFREAEPGRWVVTRITPTSLPPYFNIPGLNTRR